MIQPLLDHPSAGLRGSAAILIGHFGIKEWNSLPDTVRAAKDQPLAPLKSDGLGQIRSDLQKALQDVFGKWLDA